MLQLSSARVIAALLWLAATAPAWAEGGAPELPADEHDHGEAVAIGALPSENGPTSPAASDFLENGKKLYSQLREEVIIRDFLHDRRDGVFVDVGCAYPRMYSTTFFLENHLGWSGIGIDAVASYGESWAKERPKSKFLNYFVTDHSGTMDTFYATDYRPVSSGYKDMVEGKKYKEIKVPSATLNDILQQSKIDKIDFLSMDIEGGQLPALNGFDIKKYRPDLVCIEDYVPDRDAIFQYFEKNGYELLEEYQRFDIVNWYFAPKDRPPRAPWEPPARDPTTTMAADGLPVGSYRQTCKECKWVGDTLSCQCLTLSGEYVQVQATTPCVRGFSNKGGHLLACEG